MHIREAPLAGVLIVEPQVFRDERGFFVETYRADRYHAAAMPDRFVQDNHSRSVRGTLRGLHWQWRRPQGKLVRVVEGAIFDVAVDLRPESPTFGRWWGTELTAESFRQLYVPPRFAHGFCVVSDVAQVEYKCTELYDGADQGGLIWNDPDLAIEWPIASPILSPRDRAHPGFIEQFGPAAASRPVGISTRTSLRDS
jgi:dTDP-4-dehydrorhamnose 3,5-epimerase